MSRVTVNQEKLQALEDAKRAVEIEKELERLDFQSIRALRASIAGEATEADTNKLKSLEAEAKQLRTELATKRGK